MDIVSGTPSNEESRKENVQGHSSRHTCTILFDLATVGRYWKAKSLLEVEGNCIADPMEEEEQNMNVSEGNRIKSQRKTYRGPQWRLKDRVKTVSGALMICLNLGVDPPDLIKPYPSARIHSWVDPSVPNINKPLEVIGKNLVSQYEFWQPKAKFRPALDPTADDLRKLCINLRKSSKDERILFHYNGHGVPKPTANGELWVFNKQYTQYIPCAIQEIHGLLSGGNHTESGQWKGPGAPVLYIFDCSSAGHLVSALEKFHVQKKQEYMARVKEIQDQEEQEILSNMQKRSLSPVSRLSPNPLESMRSTLQNRTSKPTASDSTTIMSTVAKVTSSEQLNQQQPVHKENTLHSTPTLTSVSGITNTTSPLGLGHFINYKKNEETSRSEGFGRIECTSPRSPNAGSNVIGGFYQQQSSTASTLLSSGAIKLSGVENFAPPSSSSSGQIPPFPDMLVLAACQSTQHLSLHPDMPCDLFTSCLTTPIEMAIRYYILFQNPPLHLANLEEALRLPGKLQDRKSSLGELHWVFTAITDTIAWNILDKSTFQKLYRQDTLVAAMFRHFLLAERVMTHLGGIFHCENNNVPNVHHPSSPSAALTGSLGAVPFIGTSSNISKGSSVIPVSVPALPSAVNHSLWETWDAALEWTLNRQHQHNIHRHQDDLFTIKKSYKKINYSYGSYNRLPNIRDGSSQHPQNSNDFFSLNHPFFPDQLQGFAIYLARERQRAKYYLSQLQKNKNSSNVLVDSLQPNEDPAPFIVPTIVGGGVSSPLSYPRKIENSMINVPSPNNLPILLQALLSPSLRLTSLHLLLLYFDLDCDSLSAPPTLPSWPANETSLGSTMLSALEIGMAPYILKLTISSIVGGESIAMKQQEQPPLTANSQSSNMSGSPSNIDLVGQNPKNLKSLDRKSTVSALTRASSSDPLFISSTPVDRQTPTVPMVSPLLDLEALLLRSVLAGLWARLLSPIIVVSFEDDIFENYTNLSSSFNATNTVEQLNPPISKQYYKGPAACNPDVPLEGEDDTSRLLLDLAKDGAFLFFVAIIEQNLRTSPHISVNVGTANESTMPIVDSSSLLSSADITGPISSSFSKVILTENQSTADPVRPSSSPLSTSSIQIHKILSSSNLSSSFTSDLYHAALALCQSASAACLWHVACFLVRTSGNHCWFVIAKLIGRLHIKSRRGYSSLFSFSDRLLQLCFKTWNKFLSKRSLHDEMEAFQFKSITTADSKNSFIFSSGLGLRNIDLELIDLNYSLLVANDLFSAVEEIHQEPLSKLYHLLPALKSTNLINPQLHSFIQISILKLISTISNNPARSNTSIECIVAVLKFVIHEEEHIASDRNLSQVQENNVLDGEKHLISTSDIRGTSYRNYDESPLLPQTPVTEDMLLQETRLLLTLAILWNFIVHNQKRIHSFKMLLKNYGIFHPNQDQFSDKKNLGIHQMEKIYTPNMKFVSNEQFNTLAPNADDDRCLLMIWKVVLYLFTRYSGPQHNTKESQELARLSFRHHTGSIPSSSTSSFHLDDRAQWIHDGFFDPFLASIEMDQTDLEKSKTECNKNSNLGEDLDAASNNPHHSSDNASACPFISPSNSLGDVSAEKMSLLRGVFPLSNLLIPRLTLVRARLDHFFILYYSSTLHLDMENSSVNQYFPPESKFVPNSVAEESESALPNLSSVRNAGPNTSQLENNDQDPINSFCQGFGNGWKSCPLHHSAVHQGGAVDEPVLVGGPNIYSSGSLRQRRPLSVSTQTNPIAPVSTTNGPSGVQSNISSSKSSVMHVKI